MSEQYGKQPDGSIRPNPEFTAVIHDSIAKHNAVSRLMSILLDFSADAAKKEDDAWENMRQAYNLDVDMKRPVYSRMTGLITDKDKP